MSKDNRNSRGGGGNGGGTSLLAGLMIGLFVGVAVAVGVALYMNRANSPFSSKSKTPPADAVSAASAAEKQPEIMRPGSGRNDPQVAPLPASVPASVVAQQQADSQPDFHDLLTSGSNNGNGNTNANSNATVTNPSPKVNKDTRKPDVVSTPPAVATTTRAGFLQVGAFRNPQDADNLKARLAMLGVEAKISTVEAGNQGLLHRVRVGPFTTMGELDKAREQLRANGVDSDVIKPN